ncbi:MAG: hypothetical protein KBG73_03045 [Candidatus Promineofilum sp.]|nr:hypothetical protein [Promineifilum sp.]
MNDPLMLFLAATIALIGLVFLQRWIHAHLHGVSLLLTGRPEWAVIVYAVILFPGVFLHEASHWLAATLTGVRTGGVSLLPRRQPDGTLQLGYVEYYKGRTLGPFRESFIGAAPLIAGTAVILLIGYRVFSVTQLAGAVQTGDISTLADALAAFIATPNFFVWLYLLFAIGNAMLPSRSDRHAWPAFLLWMGALTIAVAFLTRGTDVLDNLARPVATLFGYLAIALSIAIAVDLLFMVVIALLEWLLGRVRGMSVVYGRQANES